MVLLDDVSVKYRLALEPPLSLKGALILRRRRRVVEHLALHGISLAVRHGETLGVIGRNGAGKTTLLNVLARVLPLSEGRLRIRGRVAPLIDLFSGLHFELTGRENVFLRGAFLGLKRHEIRARVEEIAAFADLGAFFDAPLRTYSAGMLLRLGFAIVTTLDADIFLMDEILAVGDAEFQKKCAVRIQELHARGGTFIVVSHDLGRLAAMSDRMLWLDGGRARLLADPGCVVAEYARATA